MVAPSSGTRIAIARLLLALFGGALAGAIGFALVRATRPERQPLEMISGTAGKRTKRVLWTLFVIVVYLVGTYFTAPGVNEVELMHVIYRGHRGSGDFTQFSMFALGLMPLMTAFGLVEVAASIKPSWRPLRDSLRGRKKLELAVTIVAIVLSIVQAYFVTKYIDALSRGGAEIFDHRLFWPAMATFASGPLLLAVLASVITSRGLGNGYAVLIVVGWFWGMPLWDFTHVPHSQLAFAALVIATTAIVILVLVSWRVRSPGRVGIPLPAAGIIPLHDGGGAISIILALTALGVTMPRQLTDLMPTLRGSFIVGSIALVIATLFWAFVFARPDRRREQLAPIEPSDKPLWVRAVALSVVALVSLFLLSLIRPTGVVGRLCDPAIIVTVALVLADLHYEWRARKAANLVAVWPLHDPLLLDRARDVLDGIPYFIQARRLRQLLWMFGSYVPMIVLVPEDRAAEAHGRLRDWLDPTRPS